jgi:hypothetical protein
MISQSKNGSVTVFVNLPTIFAQYRPEAVDRSAFPVTLRKGSSLRDLMTELRMPHDLPELIFINQRRCQADDILQNGSSVEMFPTLNYQ